MVTIPTKYYGTSSMQYGEVDYSGNVVNSPQQISQPKSSAITQQAQLYSSYVQQRPQSRTETQQPISIVTQELPRYDPMQSISRSPSEIFTQMQKPVEQKPQYTQLSQRELDIYGIGRLNSGPIKAEDDTYIKNKQIQISDYNTRARAIMNDNSIASSGENMKRLDNERMNIIADISTRPGVQYSEKTNTYIVPVDPDKYNAGNYKTLKLDNLNGEKITIGFVPAIDRSRLTTEDPLSEDIGGFNRLGRWFTAGYSDKPGNREYKNILETGFESLEDIESEKAKEISVKVFGDLPPELRGGSSIDDSKSALGTAIINRNELLKSDTIQGKESRLYSKADTLNKEMEVFNKENEQYDTDINKLYTSKSFIDYQNAMADYDSVFAKYGSDDVSVMSDEDRNKIIKASEIVNKNQAILEPSIKDFKGREIELNSKNLLLQEKAERLQNVLTDVGESKINIQNRDPVKAWQYVLGERLRSSDTSIPDKILSGAAMAPLMGIKTVTRDPIEFLIAAPVASYQEDKEFGRKTQLPTTYLARGIYDWRADKGERFNPDALSGAITVGTVGTSTILGALAKPATGVVAGSAAKTSIFTAKNLLIGGTILGIPPAIEGVNYLRTPADQRPTGWEVYGNLAGGYGSIAALYGASYVAGKVGAGVGQSVRSTSFKNEMYNKLADKDYEFISFKDSTGKVLKKPIVKGASDETRKRIYAEVLIKDTSRGDVIIRMSEKQLRAANNYKLVGRTNLPKIQYKIVDNTAKTVTKKQLTEVLEGKGRNLERGTVMDFSDNVGWKDLGEGFSTERGIFFKIGGKEGFVTKGTALSGAEGEGVQLGTLKSYGYTVFKTSGKNPKYYVIPGKENTGYYSKNIDPSGYIEADVRIQAASKTKTGVAKSITKQQYDGLISGTMTKKEFAKFLKDKQIKDLFTGEDIKAEWAPGKYDDFTESYNADIGKVRTDRYVQSVTESGLPFVGKDNIKKVFTGKSATDIGGGKDFVVPSGTKVNYNIGMTDEGIGVTKITYNPQGTPKPVEVIPSNVGGVLTVDKTGNIKYVIPKSEVSRLGLKDIFTKMIRGSKKGAKSSVNIFDFGTKQPVTATFDDGGNVVIKGNSKNIDANRLILEIDNLASQRGGEVVTALRSNLPMSALPQIIRSSNIQVPLGSTRPITSPTTFTSTRSSSGILNLESPSSMISPVSSIKGVQELFSSPEQIPKSETNLIGETGTQMISEITPVQELIPSTSPVSVISMITTPTSIIKTDTLQTTELETINEINRVPPPIEIPPPIIFPPWFGWPEVPNTAGGRRRKVKVTRTINPLADYRVFFKRSFGYYGLPGVTRNVNIYDTKFKDETDVGNFEAKVNKLLGK